MSKWNWRFLFSARIYSFRNTQWVLFALEIFIIKEIRKLTTFDRLLHKLIHPKSSSSSLLFGVVHKLSTLTSKGEGSCPNVNNTTKVYLVNLSTKEGEGGGSKIPKNMSTWFMYGSLKTIWPQRCRYRHTIASDLKCLALDLWALSSHAAMPICTFNFFTVLIRRTKKRIRWSCLCYGNDFQYSTYIISSHM